MAKDWAEQFYNSKRWHDCRRSFISKRRSIDGGMCQRCHDRLGYIVHHKIELTPMNIGDPFISLSHSNLQYLCHECHNEAHDAFVAKNRVTFDADGNIAACTDSPHHF